MTDRSQHSIRQLGHPQAPPRLLPPSSPSAPLEPPRGRLIQAENIITRWFLDAETGAPLVSARWVRQNMPYKQVLSHSKIGWYEQDIEAIVAIARRDRVKIRDVKLDYLEKKAG